MKNILVDSIIWIEFFRERGVSVEAEVLQGLIMNENNIFICPVIYQEVLQGVRDDKIKEMK